MTTVSGNNYTFIGTDLVNCIGGLIQRSGITANSSDTLPTATDIITSFTGVNSSSNIGQSFSFAIFNNSAFNITLVQNTGLTFIGTTTDDIFSQGVRTYTVIQTAVSTAVIYIVGNSPVNPDISNNLYLTNHMIFIGNSSNMANGVALSGDATIINTGAITLSNTSVTPASYTLSNITVDSKGRITAASNGITGSNTQLFFNNSGSLGASANLTFSSNILTVSGTITDGTLSIGSGSITNGVNAIFSGIIETTNGSIRIGDSSSINSVSLLSPSLASSYSLTLPINDGNSGEILTTNGTGVLYWASVTGDSYATVSTTPYTILLTESIINVDTSTIAITLTLPQISVSGIKKYTITDYLGNCENFNITINRSSTDTIAGDISALLNINFSSISIYNDGVSKWIIY